MIWLDRIAQSRAANPPALICRHCRVNKVGRPRGLCWSCYYKPGVRELYPSNSKYAYRGAGNNRGHDQPLPASPTSALPGTEAKIQVLMQRAANGESLWHPDDFGAGVLTIENVSDAMRAQLQPADPSATGLTKGQRLVLQFMNATDRWLTVPQIVDEMKIAGQFVCNPTVRTSLRKFLQFGLVDESRQGNFVSYKALNREVSSEAA